MMQTVEALIDENGTVSLLEAVHLPSACRALVTILEEPAAGSMETTLLSEAALTVDGKPPAQIKTSSHLQPYQKARLARECAKLDPLMEKRLAEEGLTADLMQWPEY